MALFSKQEGGQREKFPPIDNVAFIKAWMKYDTVPEVAKALDISRKRAWSKSTWLRKQGVKLPTKINRPVSFHRTEKLNKLIERLSKKG